MDPKEIVIGLTNVDEVAAGSIPSTGIVKAMLGDAAGEVAQQLRDQIRVYRYGRSLKLLERAERMAQDVAFTETFKEMALDEAVNRCHMPMPKYLPGVARGLEKPNYRLAEL